MSRRAAAPAFNLRLSHFETNRRQATFVQCSIRVKETQRGHPLKHGATA